MQNVDANCFCKFAMIEIALKHIVGIDKNKCLQFFPSTPLIFNINPNHKTIQGIQTV